MKASAFTWAGLGIAAVGWALLIASLVISDSLLKGGTAVAVMTARADCLTVAQSAIISGFGLAIIGVLRSGFGAFSHFFQAVLQRSNAPRPQPQAPIVQPMPQPAPAVPVADQDDEELEGEYAPMVTPMAPASKTASKTTLKPSVTATPKPTRPSAGTVNATAAKPKNYVILADGSVEVETMFGTRVFATLDEARDFIR